MGITAGPFDKVIFSNNSMFKASLKNLLLICVSLAVSLLIAEIVLRQIYPTDTGSSVDFRIPHPVFGWTLKPNTKYLNKMPEATVPVEYNSGGWRDTEHNVQNLDNKFRILVLGDSYMEAYSVAAYDAFFKQLEILAQEKGIVVEVINLGVGGYGTLQEYLVFSEIGEKYNPDIVLLGFYLWNDVRNNSYDLESMFNKTSMKTKSRPFLNLHSMPDWKVSQVDYKGAMLRYLESKEKHNSFTQSLKRNSALLQALTENKKHLKKNNLGYSEKKMQDDRFQLSVYGVHYCRETREYTQAWKATEMILNRFKNEIHNIGANMMIFTVPAWVKLILTL